MSQPQNKIGMYNSNNPYVNGMFCEDLQNGVSNILAECIPQIKNTCTNLVMQKIEPLLIANHKKCTSIKADIEKLIEKFDSKTDLAWNLHSFATETANAYEEQLKLSSNVIIYTKNIHSKDEQIIEVNSILTELNECLEFLISNVQLLDEFQSEVIESNQECDINWIDYLDELKSMVIEKIILIGNSCQIQDIKINDYHKIIQQISYCLEKMEMKKTEMTCAANVNLNGSSGFKLRSFPSFSKKHLNIFF